MNLGKRFALWYPRRTMPWKHHRSGKSDKESFGNVSTVLISWIIWKRQKTEKIVKRDMACSNYIDEVTASKYVFQVPGSVRYKRNGNKYAMLFTQRRKIESAQLVLLTRLQKPAGALVGSWVRMVCSWHSIPEAWIPSGAAFVFLLGCSYICFSFRVTCRLFSCVREGLVLLFGEFTIVIDYSRFIRCAWAVKYQTARGTYRRDACPGQGSWFLGVQSWVSALRRFLLFLPASLY